MKTKVILSAVGSDRPGLTQALAEAVHEAGGNWLESHLSRLGGTYVGSVLVEIDEEAVARLSEAVGKVDSGGLHVSLAPAGDAGEASGYPLSIEVVGQDRPGIVRQVTAVLAKLGVNIEDFSSSARQGPYFGEPIFTALVKARVPEEVAFDEVQSALEAISGEIMVDLTISHQDN